MSLSNEERDILVALEIKKARETYDENSGVTFLLDNDDTVILNFRK